jgi:hypothetical protein
VEQLSRARRTAWLGVLLLLGACETTPPAESATPAYCPSPPALPVNAQGLIILPPALRQDTPDPDAAWAYALRETLAQPQRLAGRGAATAQGLAQLEYLTNSFNFNQRFRTLPVGAQPRQQVGSRAMRAWLGIAPATPDAEVVGALFATECALRANDRAAAAQALARVAQAPDALDIIAPPGGAPPALPRTTVAAASGAAWAIEDQERGPVRFGR